MDNVKLSKKQKECLVLMYERSLVNYGEGFMPTRGMNGRLKEALVKKGVVRYSDGYGWKYGGIIEITEEGKAEAKKLKG